MHGGGMMMVTGSSYGQMPYSSRPGMWLAKTQVSLIINS